MFIVWISWYIRITRMFPCSGAITGLGASRHAPLGNAFMTLASPCVKYTMIFYHAVSRTTGRIKQKHTGTRPLLFPNCHGYLRQVHTVYLAFSPSPSSGQVIACILPSVTTFYSPCPLCLDEQVRNVPKCFVLTLFGLRAFYASHTNLGRTRTLKFIGFTNQ